VARRFTKKISKCRNSIYKDEGCVKENGIQKKFFED